MRCFLLAIICGFVPVIVSDNALTVNSKALRQSTRRSQTLPNDSKTGTKILITSGGRSGSTFVGQVFNLHPNSMYMYEPCRALINKTRAPISACTDLIKAIFDCSFTLSDLAMLLEDKLAVKQSRVLRQIATKVTAGIKLDGPAGKALHRTVLAACRQSTRIVKEICFPSGVPDSLMHSEVKVLYLVRDPRAVLHSRLAVKGFPMGTVGAENDAADLDFLLFYKFVKFEEVAAEPLSWTQRIYTWAGLLGPGPKNTLPSFVVKWVIENTQGKKTSSVPLGPYPTERDTAEVVDKWRGREGDGGLSEDKVREVNHECEDILHKLNYSIAPEFLPPSPAALGSSAGFHPVG